ncbi:MAG: hypothetical protein GY754_15700 [bacterium]|nr:hypothetical protein [bacterium]
MIFVRYKKSRVVTDFMDKIIVFNNTEKEIMSRFKLKLTEMGSREYEITAIDNNENALLELGQAISLYPSILGQQRLGSTSRSVATLVDNLCLKDVMDLILHIPTKAILGQSFSIAKINFFLMLKYLRKEVADLEVSDESIRKIVSNNVFTLMAEEVFIAIISDKKIPFPIRTKAGYLLAQIWEYRIDHGVKDFAPMLTDIWSKREQLVPAYGTMLGISELFMLSKKMDPFWLEYLESDTFAQDDLDSLQEFLLGLSFEQMETLSEKMEVEGKASLSPKEVESVIGTRFAFPEYDKNDPRTLFKSFSHRKNNAIYRSRGDSRGPKKTIEEYLMCYLLSKQKE